MSKNVKILGVSGSIRSNYTYDTLLENLIIKSTSKEELLREIDAANIKFSNTDIAVAYALLGAKQLGAEVRFLTIKKLFGFFERKLFNDESSFVEPDIANIDTLSIEPSELNKLINEIDNSEGIVLGSPVYFGDRSSVANKLLQITNRNKLLDGKAFGSVAVGAKRNGGQETTIIYTLFDALTQNAIVVGNGPPNAQYGGTVVAGDIGKAKEDLEGLGISYRTGSRVFVLSNILKKGKENNVDTKLNITLLITMDTYNRKYENMLIDYFRPFVNSHNINIINLTCFNIYRCVACKICPSPSIRKDHLNEKVKYGCVIQDEKDSLKCIQGSLLNSDCIVVAGVNAKEEIVTRYQAFIERTRFMRRDDFHLTNVPIVGLLINEIDAKSYPLHNVKVLTSFIRHNTFVMKPLQIVICDGRIIFSDDFKGHIRLLQYIKNGRKLSSYMNVSYKATGYSDKCLDSTHTMRK